MRYHLGEAIEFATKNSQDVGTKIGAIIIKNDNVVSIGTNNYRNNDADEDLVLKGYQDRQWKYAHIYHAEHDAILNADVDLQGAHITVTCMPCANCAKRIVDAGIKSVACPDTSLRPLDEQARWQKSWDESKNILMSSDVEIISL